MVSMVEEECRPHNNKNLSLIIGHSFWCEFQGTKSIEITTCMGRKNLTLNRCKINLSNAPSKEVLVVMHLQKV